MDENLKNLKKQMECLVELSKDPCSWDLTLRLCNVLTDFEKRLIKLENLAGFSIDDGK